MQDEITIEDLTNWLCEELGIQYWKDVPGYEGYYQASLGGYVKSLGNGNTRNTLNKCEHLLRKSFNKNNGYESVQLWKDSKHKRFSVHKVIWVTFKGEIPKGYEINHINENKLDNRLANLEILTHTENVNYGTGVERMRKTKWKPVAQYTKDGVFVRNWESILEAGKTLGIQVSNIGSCCRGQVTIIKGRPYKTKSAGGYRWEFIEQTGS